MNNVTPEKAAEQLAGIVEDFEVAMLVSVDGAGLPRARPMSIANDEEALRPPHRITFVTSRQAPLVKTLRSQSEICVTMQDDRRYVCLGGRATMHDDRVRIQRLWSKAMELWFPKGPSDPDIVLLDCDMNFAEYWDVSGTAGLRFVLEAGKALVQGRAINESKAGDHAELSGSLRRAGT
jgi:general stress protein 26